MKRHSFICLSLTISGCIPLNGIWSRNNLDPVQVAAMSQEIGLAETAADMGDLKQAEIHIRRALDLKPKATELLIRLGRIQNQRQVWVEARPTWEKVTKLDPDEPVGWAGLAEAETALGDFDAAIQHLGIAIDLAPQRSETHLKMGELYEAMGRPNEALTSYLNCLNIDLDHSKALLRVARLQRERGQPIQAIVRLNRVLELNPDQADALLYRGLAYRDTGQTKLAVTDLQRALELESNRNDIKLELALLLESTSKPEEALKLVREVLEQSPELIGARELNERLIR